MSIGFRSYLLGTSTTHAATPQPRRSSSQCHHHCHLLLQLEAIKAEGGTGAVEVGAVAADKPLAQLLQENKEKKDAEFQEKLKIIKQGE
jgi:hypothetical protein